MPVFIALLRAVNVGGHAVVPMARLRDLFEGFGLKDVRTYIQTGNVVFRAPAQAPASLARMLEARLGRALGRKTEVFVLTPAEMKRAAARNPFDPAGKDRDWRCHLVFLSGAPAPGNVAALKALERGEYRFVVRGRVLYYGYPRVLSMKRRRSLDLEGVLDVRGTARAANVVDVILALAEGRDGV